MSKIITMSLLHGSILVAREYKVTSCNMQLHVAGCNVIHLLFVCVCVCVCGHVSVCTCVCVCVCVCGQTAVGASLPTHTKKNPEQLLGIFQCIKVSTCHRQILSSLASKHHLIIRVVHVLKKVLDLINCACNSVTFSSR